ncbi:hypothetical protein RA266_28095, partial [Pseudomonas syringae pv. tagetis]|uniref:hypothetical protein n=1 Tax=Pseudomonas syringae group genomosp. 7 TaxID=251699 RepID=UPI00377059B3
SPCCHPTPVTWHLRYQIRGRFHTPSRSANCLSMKQDLQTSMAGVTRLSKIIVDNLVKSSFFQA